MATGMFSWFLVGKKLCGLPLGSLWLPHQPRAAGCHLRGGKRLGLPPFLFLSVQCSQPPQRGCFPGHHRLWEGSQREMETMADLASHSAQPLPLLQEALLPQKECVSPGP